MLCKFQLYKIRLSFWFLYPLPIFVIKLCVCDFKSFSMVGIAPTGAKVTNQYKMGAVVIATLGCSWRRDRSCQADHIEQASSIECYFIKSGMLSKLHPSYNGNWFSLISVCNCCFFHSIQVSLLADFLEKWEKDDSTELILIKVSSDTSRKFNLTCSFCSVVSWAY